MRLLARNYLLKVANVLQYRAEPRRTAHRAIAPPILSMLKLGIVGLPNVGKSTLFNALTSAGVLAANYPFATKDPNVGRVSVPDPRLDVLAKIVDPERTVPAAVEFVDIAGLVKGASQGEG